MTQNKFFTIFLLSIFCFNARLCFAQATLQPSNSEFQEISEPVFDKIDSSRFYSKAVLQILNKTTAKTSIEEISIGSSIEIGKLTIKAHKCWQAPLEQRPDSKILLEIKEVESSDNIKNLFLGWMFASSPSISGLEHPIYDIIAIGCKK